VSAEHAKIVGATYFKVHLIPFFASFEHFTPAMYADYGRTRLQKVSRPTVRKELCALRRFVAWCGDHDLLLPAVPPLQKHGQPGKRAKNARKRRATIITEAIAKRILMAMPERSRRTGEWVRPLFTVLWETGLRPKTVLRLEAPLHYRKGSDTLFISREIDKEGFERTIPLSAAARGALDRVCSDKPGRLFEAKSSSLRHSVASALAAAGLEELDVSPYDFRHSRITAMANAPGPLTGASFLAGHKHASTTSLYIQGGEQAARETLAAMATAKPHPKGRRAKRE
jgi:integrase